MNKLARCCECENVLLGRPRGECPRCKALICLNSSECQTKHFLRHREHDRAQATVDKFVDGASDETLTALTLKDFMQIDETADVKDTDFEALAEILGSDNTEHSPELEPEHSPDPNVPVGKLPSETNKDSRQVQRRKERKSKKRNGWKLPLNPGHALADIEKGRKI